uniref:AlNc14C24G2412 protein n=1 Tax=Albugo laibachii Nc14 TaxID=890382 RepID=F0W6B2_9STRA|nr:AlNc14C24G2412 [Albugo laibachii Nc14]|eukprot:CCA16655.1 AlNc14C24G2412 [Albugo laibachii Nc14]
MFVSRSWTAMRHACGAINAKYVILYGPIPTGAFRRDFPRCIYERSEYRMLGMTSSRTDRIRNYLS